MALAYGHGGSEVEAPSDGKTQRFLRTLFPVDPYWRFGTVFTADRKARKLRAENQRRQNAHFQRVSR